MPKPFIPNDKWSQKAQSQGFRARSVYKLEELDQKFNLADSGMKVLDIGAAPGSWMQYLSTKVKGGFVLGLDLQTIRPITQNTVAEVCDILSGVDVQNSLTKHNLDQVDLIVSDLAPSTSGIKHRDQLLSFGLSFAVFNIAKKYLKENGNLVIKYFQGPKGAELTKLLKENYKTVVTFKPKASRDRSLESYFVCLGKK